MARKLIAAILLGSTMLHADPIRLQANVAFIPKEQGWYFNDTDEHILRARLVEADYIEKKLGLEIELNVQLRKLADENAKLSELYRQAFINENDQVVKLAKRESFNKWLYLGLGVALTIGAGFAIGYVGKNTP